MIGGEFEIDIALQRNGFIPQPNTYYYASGRAALYQILRSLATQYHKIWLPDWLCHTMIEAVVKAGFDYSFYELDERFKPTLNALDKSGFKDGNVVLMVNYFGLQDLTETAKAVKEICSNSVIIEDDVQAFWAFEEIDNPYVDYRFTSLRKGLPIPDGGLVKTKKVMHNANKQNTFAPLKLKAGMMKFNRWKDEIHDEDYLALFKKADELISQNYESIMSEDSQRLLTGINVQKAKQRRQDNSSYILNGLEKLNIKPLIPVIGDAVPLFVPIYLKNRDEVRRRMFQNNVFCPVHWPLNNMPVKCGRNMAEHELSLIIDQRYSKDDMELILSLL